MPREHSDLRRRLRGSCARSRAVRRIASRRPLAAVACGAGESEAHRCAAHAACRGPRGASASPAGRRHAWQLASMRAIFARAGTATTRTELGRALSDGFESSTAMYASWVDKHRNVSHAQACRPGRRSDGIHRPSWRPARFEDGRGIGCAILRNAPKASRCASRSVRPVLRTRIGLRATLRSHSPAARAGRADVLRRGDS